MVFGHPGPPGLHAANHVEGDHQQDQDPAVVKHVGENLVLEAALKTNVVMRDVAVSNQYLYVYHIEDFKRNLFD